MKKIIQLTVALLLTLGLYSNSFGQYPQDPPPAGYSSIYRMYNSSSGKHLLAGRTEADNLTSYGGTPWVNEGLMGFVNNTSGEPIYRFYSNSAGHYFSTNSTAPAGYVSEGLIGYGWSAPMTALSTPVYRYVRISGGTKHLYTTNYSELAGNPSWRYEGIEFHLFIRGW